MNSEFYRFRTDSELEAERRVETSLAREIINFLSAHPNGSQWGAAYVDSRNGSPFDVADGLNGLQQAQFNIEKTLHLLAFSNVTELEFSLAMNRVYYKLRDNTYLLPEERKGDAS
jgi:hypothetical protein